MFGLTSSVVALWNATTIFQKLQYCQMQSFDENIQKWAPMCGLTIMVSRRLAECEANRPRHYDLSNFPTVHCNVYMVGCNVRHEVQCMYSGGTI